MRTNKYNVAPVTARTVDGIRFDSKAEMHRYQELKLLERGGHIQRLECQPQFMLVNPFVTAGGAKFRGVKYRGDFRYLECGRVVVEDVKGHATEVYRIKKQLFALRFPDIIFREVISRRRR